MRKTLITGLIALLSSVLIYGFADAKVSGSCASCHIMHNSENGNEDVTGQGPLAHLLRDDCQGCHINIGYPVPYEVSTGNRHLLYVEIGAASSDTNQLAGGYFTSNDPVNTGKSHSLNVIGTPPGYPDVATDYRDTAYSAAAALTCAGTQGCHGLSSAANEMTAITGGHHGTDNATLGGKWIYRILADKGPVAVSGSGASDYEYNLNIAPSVGDQKNTYSAGVGNNTISKLCAGCHGKFHSDVLVSGEWVRHPTDVDIPNDWAIVSPFTNYTGDANQWKRNPVGYDGAVGAGNAQSTCLSCHRAHGSPNADLLRFDYALMDAGTTAVNYGCLGCHNKQRGP